VDLFSMGAVFFNIVTNQGLFEGWFKNLKDFLFANRDCNLTHIPDRLKEYSPGLREFIIKMIAVRPEDRP
jgi:hypothetical protein